MGKRRLKKGVFFPCGKKGKWLFRGLKRGVFCFHVEKKENGCFRANLPAVILGKREQVVRRLTRDAHTQQILESLPCEIHLQAPLHRRCLPGCGPHTCATRDIQTTFVYRLQPLSFTPPVIPERLSPAPFHSGGGGVPCSFLRPFRLRLFRYCCGVPHFRIFLRVVPLRTAHLGLRL